MIRYVLVTICAMAVVAGCGGPFGGITGDPSAPLQLSMRVLEENELTLSAPDDVSFECDPLVNEAALAQWLSSADVSSECGGARVVNDFTGLSDECGTTGATTVTWTASDDCGNTIVHTATFGVVDTVAPVFAGPSDVAIDCGTGGAGSPVRRWLNSVDVSDGCSDVELSVETRQLSDGCGEAATTRARWTAVDRCGNTSTYTATLTVRGTDPLFVVIPPDDVTVECDGAGNENAFDRWVAAATTQGGCGGEVLEHAVTRTHEPCAGASDTQVTWTATDSCDASTSASAIFSIVDTTAPRVAAPDDLLLECGDVDNRAAINAWLDSATSQDLCSEVVLSNNYAGLRTVCGASGAAVVTWTGADACGNTRTASARLDVVDSLPPRLAVPEDRRFCTGDSNLRELDRWLAAAESADQCGEVLVEHDFSRDRVNDDCTIDVTWTATDACGHVVSDSARAGIQDAEPPVISLNGEPELTLECNVDTYAELGAAVVDTCDVELTRAVVAGDTVDVSTPGSYVVRYDAADLCGNEAESKERSVVVVDTLPPFAPDGIALDLWPPNHQYVSLSLADCVRDLCETDLDVDAVGQIVSIYSDEPEDANGDGNTSADIVIVDHSSFMVRAERQGGGNGRVYGVTFDIADSAGNATRDTCWIAVPHDDSGRQAVDDGAASGYTIEP